MLRMVLPAVYLLMFIGWLIYRAFVKKDLKNHMNGVYAGLFFFAVWTGIFYLILS